ncbi:hypothetical protein JCM21900_002894 [Sporobolomyces salmonicolor]
MVLETIYVARHGFRLSWETPIWTSPTGVPRDPPLSAHGVDQANELGAFLKRELGVTEDEAAKGEVLVLSSPLYRCVQTATPTAEALGLPILIEPGLGEWYLPVLRGLHPALSTASFLQSFFPLVSTSAPSSSTRSASWSPLLTPPRTGESMHQIHLRCLGLLRLLVPELERRGVRKVVLFSHAATVIALSRALAGDLQAVEEGGEGKEWRDEERLACRAATCSVSKFERVGNDREEEGAMGRWKREWNGKTDFLQKGEERHWEFSFVEDQAEDGILSDGTEAAPTKSDNYKELPTAAPKETVAKEKLEGKL